MDLSVNSDFISSSGDFRAALRLISEAGFKYVHWGHHWCDDFLYSSYEIARIGKILNEYGLQLFDLHSSHGVEKHWCSTDETARLAGKELLLNRIRMTHELGGRAIVLHTNTAPLSDKTRNRAEQGVKTLKALEPQCRDLGIRIGMENLFDNGGESSFYDLNRYFSEFSSDYIGFCWDSGHSHMVKHGLERIIPMTAERLLILHLHDNNGIDDEHLPIGESGINWDRVAQIIAESPYDGVLTQEVVLPKGADPASFLKKVHKQGMNFSRQIEGYRNT